MTTPSQLTQGMAALASSLCPPPPQLDEKRLKQEKLYLQITRGIRIRIHSKVRRKGDDGMKERGRKRTQGEREGWYGGNKGVRTPLGWTNRRISAAAVTSLPPDATRKQASFAAGSIRLVGDDTTVLRLITVTVRKTGVTAHRRS